MSKSVTEAAHFNDPEAARAVIEAELWPTGPVCGHCGEKERHYATKRPGRWRCGNPECRKDFTVTTGTVMESSHVPLHKWLLAFHIGASSKKGFSAHQLHRTLKITYKSAWFLWHRVREAMRTGGLTPMGGSGKIVEADETYYGPVAKPRARSKSGKPYKGGGPHNKRIIVSLVERSGHVRSFHVPFATKESVMGIVRGNVDHETRLFTDEAHQYHGAGKHFAEHSTVTHSKKEYVRGEISTNTIEGFFGIFKRGMRGVYQHCDEKHLHRYLAEFDFRYNHREALGYNDETRALVALKGAVDKRLTYKKCDEARL